MSNGCTPLYIAAQEAKLEAVRILIDNGADLNKATTDVGCTPLYTSSGEGLLEVVRCLLVGGADVNVSRSDGGATPLAVASRNGHYNVALILLKGGAVETACSVRGAKAAGVTDPRMLRLLVRWRCAMCDRHLCKVRLCAQCRLVSYCGRECQRGDWAQHKAACTKKALEGGQS